MIPQGTAHERIATRVSDAELERRWEAIRAAMEARGIEAVVAQSANDWLGGAVKYLTDVPATNGYPRSVVLHRQGGMSVVEMGPFGRVQRLGCADRTHRGVEEIRTAPAFSSVACTHGYDGALVAAILRERGYRRIGLVGPGALPLGFVQAVQAAGAACEDATDWFDQIKAIKSAEEIGLIERAAALQDAVFARVLAAMAPGQRDCDITTIAQHAALELGSEQGIFLGGSAPLGRASVFLPRHMQNRRLAEGDHLALLIEVNGPGGFYTELARTMVLGRASNALLEGFEAMRAAQDHTLGLLRPGVAARDVAAAHDAYMRARDLPLETRLYSHGQGYDMVERPLIRHDETMQLRAGMCLAVHPGYETAAQFAVICDNYLLGDDGPGRCLHATEKRIFEL